ncbi:MAG: alpha/beta fold hydrolase [Lachnospiraceae bacterium]
MHIVKKTYSFVSEWDGVTIHGICMIPECPVGILQMVHGMSEHKERFLPFMERMAQSGYITLMHDNRGHGESIKEPEDIGYCYPSKDKGFVEDIFTVTRKIRKKFPHLPLILYGHSMGSLAVRAYLKEHDDAIDGLVISGCPGYNAAVPLGRMLVKIVSLFKGMRYRSPFMQQLVLGSFERRFYNEHRKNAWLAVKKSVAEEFEADALCQFTYTLNGFLTLLNLESIVYKKKGYQMQNPQLPILFLSGAEDPCYINEKKWTEAIGRLSALGYSDITAVLFDGMRHEIHNEEENEKVYDRIAAFCRQIIEKEKDDSDSKIKLERCCK